MTDQDDFKSPEEIQADSNRAKINKFISNIGWQFIVLTVVIYATFKDNSLANHILTGYGVLIGLSSFIFFLTIIKPLEGLAISNAMRKNPLMLNTPTAVTLRAIGTIFSIAEISILISFDYTALAGLWAVTEVLQYAASFKLSVASKFSSEASEMLDAKYKRDPAFEKDLEKDLKKYDEDMIDLNKLIIALDAKTLGPSDYGKALDVLIAKRVKLVDAMEARITKAAIETIRDNDENK